MKVGIFVGSVGRRSGGPERYEVELVRSLAAIDSNNEYQVLCLVKEAPELIGVSQDNVIYHRLWPKNRVLSMLTSLPLQMMRHKQDVFHATFLPPVMAVQDYIFTFVCSSMFVHPELFPPAIRFRIQMLFRLAVRKARMFVFPSKHIRDTILEMFDIPEERTRVVYLGVKRDFRPIPESECRDFLKERYGIVDPYLLFSGRWEPRKNVPRILEAFWRFKRASRSDLKLVFTGEKTWAAREADETIARLNLESDIIDLGKSPVDELPMLYAGAQALVFTSLWEGFGFPIVEGMAAGIPVITSNNSSMAEIGGDAALLVDPYSIDEIAEAMGRITSDASLGASLRAKGLLRARSFTWEKTARQTLSIYEQMAAN